MIRSIGVLIVIYFSSLALQREMNKYYEPYMFAFFSCEFKRKKNNACCHSIENENRHRKKKISDYKINRYFILKITDA